MMMEGETPPLPVIPRTPLPVLPRGGEGSHQRVGAYSLCAPVSHQCEDYIAGAHGGTPLQFNDGM
jgi:hypothetical protein